MLVCFDLRSSHMHRGLLSWELTNGEWGLSWSWEFTICLMRIGFDFGSSHMHNMDLFWSWELTMYNRGLFWSWGVQREHLLWPWSLLDLQISHMHNEDLFLSWEFTLCVMGSVLILRAHTCITRIYFYLGCSQTFIPRVSWQLKDA